MKIVHLITSLKVGGAESSLCNLLTRLNKNSDKHIVIYFHNGPNLGRLKSMGIMTHHVKGFYSSYDPIGLYRLFKLVRSIGPDLIHSSLWSANFLGSLVAKVLGIPIICDLHGDVRDHGILRNSLEKVILRIPKKFIAVSKSVKDAYVESMYDALEPRVKVIPNGIDVHDVRDRAFCDPLSREQFGLSQTDFVIGCVGRLAAIKSYDVVIRALSGLPSSVKICLVGDGPKRPRLESLTQELGITPSVVFVGERDDACRFYPLFDCFVLPSKSEGLSIALLEAMCFGLPVITTSKDGNHDVISHGENGFVVPVGDYEEIRRGVEKLLGSHEEVARIREANERLVELRFGMKSMTSQYEKIYSSVTSEKKLN